MAQEERNRVVEWLLLFRAQAPALRERLESWIAAVRAEPWVFWDTAAVRYITYGVGGLILFLIISRIPSMIGPPPPPDARSAATEGDFHVVCSDSVCGAHFVMRQKLGFRAFPVPCAKCGKLTGRRALRCNSTTCRGRWVAPVRTGDHVQCPECGGVFGPVH